MYSNPIKDWFYFTRQQRYGIIILLVLIIVVPITGRITAALRRHQDLDEESFRDMVAIYRDHLAGMEEIAAAQEANRRTYGDGDPEETTQLALAPQPFDPNTLSVEGWQEMGVSARIGRSIHNYLAAGGSFRYTQDLQRIYLMDDKLYAELESWVTLPDRPERDTPAKGHHGGQYRQASGSRTDRARTESSGTGRPQDDLAERTPVRSANEHPQTDQTAAGSSGTTEHKVPLPDHAKRAMTRPVMVNINQADTTALQQIRGIGPVFSRRIVRYRELLGGYSCASQLLEVFGMDSARYVSMLDFIETDTLLIEQINLNTASFGDLVRHPYIDQPVASAILNLRDQHGPFACPADIKSSYLIDDESWERLRPYLHSGHYQEDE